jgi:pimeloyl-ACP methyl ester carboxylesterase
LQAFGNLQRIKANIVWAEIDAQNERDPERGLLRSREIPSAERSDGARQPIKRTRREYEVLMGGAKAHYDGIVAFSQTDFTEDLKRITVPVLVMHSEDDQIVPYVASGSMSAKLLKNGTLKTYKDFPHGMPTTQAETINADLLGFFKA